MIQNDSWKLQNIFDYWDQQKDAVFHYSRELAKFDEKMRSETLSLIKNAIESYTKNFTDNDLIKYAWVMAEDLYKAANREENIFDYALFQYLDASANTFCKLLRERGFIIHYLIDNSFEQTFWGMKKPLQIYQDWFSKSGFTYICPQLIAYQIIEVKKLDTTGYFDLLPRFIDAARDIVNKIIENCHNERRHYVYLDTDWVENSFEKSLSVQNEPGIITIFRNEAPVSGSKTSISCYNADGHLIV